MIGCTKCNEENTHDLLIEKKLCVFSGKGGSIVIESEGLVLPLSQDCRMRLQDSSCREGDAARQRALRQGRA